MPVSSGRRKKKIAKRRVHIKRTSGWTLLNECHDGISAIMVAIRAHATVATDAAAIGVKEEDRSVLNMALISLRDNMIISKDPQVSVMEKATLVLSTAVGKADNNPYIKESQIGEEISQLSHLFDHVIANILPMLGTVSDILVEAPNMTPHHQYLMNLANDAMGRLTKMKPTKETVDNE